jgi:hypothetical protein
MAVIAAFLLGGYYIFKPSFLLQVPTEALSCKIDTDCTLFSPDCEDCKFEAVNKNQLTEISIQKEFACLRNPPKLMCDAMFTGEVKCIEAKCIIVP